MSTSNAPTRAAALTVAQEPDLDARTLASALPLNSRRSKAVLARKSLAIGVIHLLLVAIAFTMVLPFVWMALTSLKTLPEVGLADWLPRSPRWDNYKEVFRVVPFGRFYFNSVLVAAW